MKATERYVLHPEVVIQERRGQEGEGQYVVLRRGARVGGRAIEGTLFRLLTRFRVPTTILDAIVEHAHDEGASPENTLNDAWSSLWRLIGAGVLVDGDREWEPLLQRLRIGDIVHGARVVECVRIMEDFQVFRAILPDGKNVAVKIAPRGQDRAASLLRRERDLLLHLGGRVTPAYEGFVEDPDPTLISEWCGGIPFSQWAKGPRSNRLSTVVRLANAYAELHAAGVLHVDVNLNNALVAEDAVRLIDFAGSAWIGESPTLARVGVLGFQEPEYLAALVNRSAGPAATARGEQYGIACLLYQALTGSAPRRLSSDREVATREVITTKPRPFSDLGVFDIPGIEAPILKALSNDPMERFESVAELADAVADACARLPLTPRAVGSTQIRLVSALSPGGDWFDERFPGRPRCSVNSGAAGIGLALLELALQRDDDRALRLSADWLARAREWQGRSDAFLLDDAPRLAEIVEDGVSIFHTDVGLLWLEALQQHAGGTESARDRAIGQLSDRVARPFVNYDLTLGRTGNLVAAASLWARTGASPARALGEGLAREIAAHARTFGPIGRHDGSGLNLGMAHGWAGLIWSFAMWSRATGAPPDRWVLERGQELVGEAMRGADGALSWAWRMPGRDTVVPGWCNGAAGFVLAYCELELASGRTGEWLSIAARAGEGLLKARWGAGHLCCGAAGGVYAMARLHHLTDDPRWLAGAVRARDRALSLSGSHLDPASLYKGDVVFILLDVDVAELGQLVLPGCW